MYRRYCSIRTINVKYYTCPVARSTILRGNLYVLAIYPEGPFANYTRITLQSELSFGRKEYFVSIVCVCVCVLKYENRRLYVLLLIIFTQQPIIIIL